MQKSSFTLHITIKEEQLLISYSRILLQLPPPPPPPPLIIIIIIIIIIINVWSDCHRPSWVW